MTSIIIASLAVLIAVIALIVSLVNFKNIKDVRKAFETTHNIKVKTYFDLDGE